MDTVLSNKFFEPPNTKHTPIPVFPHKTAQRMRHTAFSKLLLLGICTAALPFASANAQVPDAAKQFPPKKAPAAVKEAAAVNLKTGTFFDLSGLGRNVGRSLADHGVYLTGRYLGEGIGQVSGGQTTGGYYEGFLLAGVDLDLKRIANINGAKLHIAISDLQGPIYSNYSGSSYSYNRAYAYGDGFRLNEFSWDQEMFDRRVRVLAGRITPATDFNTSQLFGTSQLYCQFLFSTCSAPAGFIYNKTSASYLTSAWGGVVTVKPSRLTYAKVGIYQDLPWIIQNNHNSWPGTDWNFTKGSGFTVPVEIGYHTELKDEKYPRAYSIGGFYDQGTYTDPRLNTSGESRVLTGGAPMVRRGRSGIYLQAQQMVWRPDMNSDRGATVFAAANWSTGGQTNISRYFGAGIRFKGLLLSRPNDTIGFSTSYFGMNQSLTQRINETIAVTHGGGQASGSEVSFEFNYGLNIAPGINLLPFVHYISHPDQVSLANPRGSLTHSLEVGTALTVVFAPAFGLPTLLRGGY